ncbi:hypothetical protein [Natrinema salsiterrestre]|uniref:Uncharacterized protein n=1 Tax=Natrinema salsiterrestre TaxID=2950540 RepID=A0A9Q4PZE4_9EURY|nr:hypothetical protein [Natrinema salsiterrestre]MDF9744059.1 hypothetical protein [Natrinema salsiterrestre]
MTDRELVVTVEDVSASYDHAGRLEAVELRLSYETTHETSVGKKKVTYGAPWFRFDVDGDGVARLERLESHSHDRAHAEFDGARVTDFRAIPAAVEIVEEIGDVERVESVATSVEERIGEIETVEFEAE